MEANYYAPHSRAEYRRFAFYNQGGKIVLRLNRHAQYPEVSKKKITLMQDVQTGMVYEIDSRARLAGKYRPPTGR